ncbi:toprim domain-containing protein [Sphingomonas profundi]|uniref:toprim domain-containing protein n=1 Tax=Alterirhizorhabdus profundi TaxID=2681549 RepID=UPI0012E91161|nr:toprim domain-containing protein [Sphingomonas profundi]
MYSPEILREVLQLLQRDFKFRESGQWLRGGQCPGCGKKEVYTHAEKPVVLKCGRLDKCGWDQAVKDRYPEIFDDWSKRYKATPENPTAAADAYLVHQRGIDLQGLRGAYTQEWYQDPDRRISTATIRFDLPGGSWWERLIDQPGRFSKKARFAYERSWRGQWWMPPGVSIESLAGAEELWLVEGIFDALALRQNGIIAVSLMSSNNYPEIQLGLLRKAVAAREVAGKGPLLVWALDVGQAGTYYTRKFVKQSRKAGWEATAAQVRLEEDLGAKLDWNDLHLRDKLAPENLADCRWHGEVMIADTATDKAFLLWQRKQWGSFHFTFEGQTYWASFNANKIAETVAGYAENSKIAMLSYETKRDMAAREAGLVEAIANCTFRALYKQRDEATDETDYYLRVEFPTDRPSAKGPFSASSLAAGAEFKKRLLAIGTGAYWRGTTGQLDKIMAHQMVHIRDVEPIQFTGYSRAHKAWILGDIAVKDGRVIKVNDDGFFDFGKAAAVKLRTEERILDAIDYDPDRLDTSWLDDFWTAYRAKGLVVLGFWFGALFAEQIRVEQSSLGFLEITGLPGTGKTSLIEFLWKLLGRDNYEGFDPAKATAAALARNLGKVANMPVVLMEGDRDKDASHARKFEWEELKTAYNGRSVRSRGLANGGMETFEPPFRGAIIIEQNHPVDASPAMLERIMHLDFDKEGWTEATRMAAQRIDRWPIKTISGFILHAIRRETRVMEVFHAAYARHEAALKAMPAIRNQRLEKNHAQLLAMIEAMCVVLPIGAERVAAALDFATAMACERQLAINADHPDVQVFWEKFDWIELNQGENPAHPINHARDPKTTIAVSLVEFEQRCADRRISIPPINDLKKHLKTSKVRKFVANKPVNSVNGKILQCWVFQQPGAAGATPSR